MRRVNSSLQRGIAKVLAGGMALGVVTTSSAQELEEVLVTGTRISRPDLVSNSPITTVSAETLEQLNTINLETQLRQLPQFLPGSTEYINNGNPGAATINLRGLGSVRTLVLMDGKRLPPFGTSGAVDINLIPPAIIERVDVVTGGASAVYGSDAVSGVVNFITKKDFEGLQLDTNHSQYAEGDGKTTSIALTAGGKFADDRGSAVISFAYTERDAVLQGDRAYSNFFLFANDGYRYAGTWYPYPDNIFDPSRYGGSSNATATRAAIAVGLNDSGGALFGSRWFTPDGQLLTRSGLNATQYAANQSYNYNPTNFFQVPQERWQAFASADYQLTDSVEIYGRVFAVNSDVPTQLASSAYFGGSTGAFTVNLDNPFITDAQRAVLINAYNFQATAAGTAPYDPSAEPGSQLVRVAGIRRRMLELGPRVGISESKTIQLTGGVRGDLADTGWSYDVGAQFGRVSRFDGLENDVSIIRAQNALLAIQTSDGIVCLSGPPCAPLNLFSGNGFVDPSTGQPATGAMSEEALDYVRANYYSNQTTEAKTAYANLSGEIAAIKLPSADSAMGLAVGFEWNEGYSAFRPDDLTQFGGAMGQGGNAPPLTGSLRNQEVFAEVYLPLVNGMSGIDTLGFEGGVRFTDNSLAGSFETWKAGLEYSPTPGYRLRGMVQKAVRAPNIGEQFAPISFGLTEVRGDPCAGTAPLTDAGLAAKCIAQGAPAGQLGFIENPAAQQAPNIGGGAVPLGVNLLPEEADTFTIGIQINPPELPNFYASVDYYNIEIDGGIGAYPAQEVLDNCFLRDISSFCSLIKRNALGNLEGDGFGIVQDTRNLSVLTAEGIDYSIGYRFDFSAMSLSLGLSGNHTLDSAFRSSPASPVIECQGVYGDTCGTPTAKDRATLTASLSWQDWTATLFVRHLSSVQVQARDDDPDQTGRSIYLVESIDSYQYLDLSVQYNWNDKVRLTVSATNITDEDPPIVGNIPGANTSMNTYADTYDPLGTKIALGLSVKF